MSTPSTLPSAGGDSGSKRRKRVPEPPEDLRAEAPKNQQLFKRLFSEEDEIKLLNAFLQISKTVHASPSPANTAALIFDKVGEESFRGQFTNKQLTDKLSKLRRKYAKQINNDTVLKTTHDWEVFHLSQKIWGDGEDDSAHNNSDVSPAKDHSTTLGVESKRKVKTGSQASPQENRRGKTRVHHASESDDRKEKTAAHASPPAENGGEERITVAVPDFPFLMQEVSRLPWDAVLGEGLRSLDGSVLKRLNEEWRLQHIAEVKVMAKRAQLVQEHSKLILDATDSSLPD